MVNWTEKYIDILTKKWAIRFRSSKDFDKFLRDFSLMRYPGYRWRYVDKKKEIWRYEERFRRIDLLDMFLIWYMGEVKLGR